VKKEAFFQGASDFLRVCPNFGTDQDQKSESEGRNWAVGMRLSRCAYH